MKKLDLILTDLSIITDDIGSTVTILKLLNIQFANRCPDELQATMNTSIRLLSSIHSDMQKECEELDDYIVEKHNNR